MKTTRKSLCPAFIIILAVFSGSCISPYMYMDNIYLQHRNNLLRAAEDVRQAQEMGAAEYAPEQLGAAEKALARAQECWSNHDMKQSDRFSKLAADYALQAMEKTRAARDNTAPP